MNKLWIVLFSFSISIYAGTHTIKKISGESIYIGDTTEAIGTTGIIVHQFENGFEAILGRVEVVKTGRKTAVNMLEFVDLEQDALPTIVRKPKKGDKIILNWLHHRTLLVAPTLNSYNQATKAQKNSTFVHADLFASYLSQQGHPSPLKEDFQNFCKLYDVGVLEFIIDQKLISVDCTSFYTLEEKAFEVSVKEPMLPFYSRIKELDANWWGEGSEPIPAFDAYYTTLLGQDEDE